MAKQSRPLFALLSPLIGLYMMTVVFAVPYFNWRLAKEHGFLSWLFLGEVVASAKATIWPYYAISGSTTVDTDEMSEDHLKSSVRILTEATNMMQGYGDQDPDSIPPKVISDVEKLLGASVSEAELVNETYLLRINSEFPIHFKDDYIASIKDIADGLRTGDRTELLLGATKYEKFRDWQQTYAPEYASAD
jgi:hypothetical protein